MHAHKLMPTTHRPLNMNKTRSHQPNSITTRLTTYLQPIRKMCDNPHHTIHITSFTHLNASLTNTRDYSISNSFIHHTTLTIPNILMTTRSLTQRNGATHISPVSPGDDKEMTLLYNSAPFPYFKQYLTEHSLGDHPEGFFQSSSTTINHQSSSPATAAITRKHTAQVLPQFL